MKRIFALFLTLALTVFPACKKEEGPFCLPAEYTVTGELACGKAEISLTARVTGTGSAVMEISSPETLSGYSFRLDKGSMTAYYEDIEVTLPHMESSLLLCLYEMLTVKKEDFSFTEARKNDRIDFFKTACGEVSVYIKKGENQPYMLEHSENGICFKINSLSPEQ